MSYNDIEIPQLHLEAMRNVAGFGYMLRGWRGTSNSRMIEIVQPVTFKEFEEGSRLPSDTCGAFMVLDRGQMIELMDQMWRIGIRPSNECGSVGEKAALQEHLTDMRKLSDRLLDKVLKPSELPAVSVCFAKHPRSAYRCNLRPRHEGPHEAWSIDKDGRSELIECWSDPLGETV